MRMIIFSLAIIQGLGLKYDDEVFCFVAILFYFVKVEN